MYFACLDQTVMTFLDHLYLVVVALAATVMFWL
jgi:hypothetical protein